MKIDQVSLLIEANHIKRAIISPAIMSQGKWILSFERKNGQLVTLHAQRKNIRQFARIESAVTVLNELGIKAVEINWS